MIDAGPARAADHTSRANLVGVVTNGTAMPGLGDIGPLAGKVPECFYTEKKLRERMNIPSSTTTSTAPRSSPRRRW